MSPFSLRLVYAKMEMCIIKGFKHIHCLSARASVSMNVSLTNKPPVYPLLNFFEVLFVFYSFWFSVFS